MVIQKLRHVLKSKFLSGIKSVFTKNNLNDETKDTLLEQLILWDAGVETSQKIISKLEEEYKRKDNLSETFKKVLYSILPEDTVLKFSEKKVSVIIVLGVNGSGKTTFCAKLAKYLRDKHKRKVLIAACDTFRTAAIDQIKIWAERIGVDVISGEENGDAASVAYDACSAAYARGMDTVIIDTAGRLHNKENLLNELDKIKRVISKNENAEIIDNALILDATNGVNAVIQASVFADKIGVTSLSITKLDSSAKAGFIFAIEDKLHIPIRFIGIGETEDDILLFDKKEYIDSLI